MDLMHLIWKKYLMSAIDVIIVAFIFYRVMLLIKGTRAVQITLGLLTLVILTFISKNILHLKMVTWLLESFWLVAAIILVVVFQPEIRSGLAQLGSHKWGRILFSSELSFIDEIIKAVNACSQQHIGALIVLEHEVGLRTYIEAGTILNAQVSQELILTIFNPKSQLHDGAIIVENTRLIAAGCILPLSNDLDISKVLGTRHRAAIGLSEISDAIVLVVSEETGMVSIARDGKLESNVDTEDLRKRLVNLYRTRGENILLRRISAERNQKDENNTDGK
ncbi:MAG: diadenylate cyclase CdaA [Elusimicrobiota bacterium]